MRIYRFFKGGLLFAMLALLGCSKPAPEKQWHMTDISGAMPRLDWPGSMVLEGDELISAKTYRGKVVALYFGYTHCPDVCPATLANLADAIEKVGSRDFRVLFVTVDPDRDGGQEFTQYTHAFSNQVDGLRGNANQIASLARTYRVAYDVKKGPPYEVTHSNAVFFFDKNGKARLVTTDTSDAAAMAEDVKRLLN